MAKFIVPQNLMEAQQVAGEVKAQLTLGRLGYDDALAALAPCLPYLQARLDAIAKEHGFPAKKINVKHFLRF